MPQFNGSLYKTTVTQSTSTETAAQVTARWLSELGVSAASGIVFDNVNDDYALLVGIQPYGNSRSVACSEGGIDMVASTYDSSKSALAIPNVNRMHSVTLGASEYSYLISAHPPGSDCKVMNGRLYTTTTYCVVYQEMMQYQNLSTPLTKFAYRIFADGHMEFVVDAIAQNQPVYLTERLATTYPYQVLLGTTNAGTSDIYTFTADAGFAPIQGFGFNTLSMQKSMVEQATGYPFLQLRAQTVFATSLGGITSIFGTVKEKNSPANTPLRRQVVLLDEATWTVVSSTWSDASTGNYRFDNLNASSKYTVLAYDYAHNYRAVVADNLTPEILQ